MNSVDITLENAQQLLIDESFKRPVVVDFWADWCAPCKSLMPILEKFATQFNGAFLLAKVNADEQNVIASQFGVRSLPTVMVIKDGQPIDGFSGAQTEIQVRDLLEKYLPKPWELPLAEAQQLMAASDYASALPLLRKAYDESKHLAAIAFLLVESNIALNRLESAEAILSTIKAVDRNEQYDELIAQIALKKQIAKSPELLALEAAYASESDNMDTAYQLALQYVQAKDYRPALELLINILRKNRSYGDGQARKTLTDLLVLLGKGDPLAIEFQRKLFTLLY
ncbi:MAG: thioredoxin [Pseudomonadota bacterium]